jgi:hypothetical protein
LQHTNIYPRHILPKLLIVPFCSHFEVDIDRHDHLKRLVPLGLCFTLSLVLDFGSVLSHTDMNMALAVDMSNAPVTKDAITEGSDGDDEDQGDDDQGDPVTQDTITAGEESRDDNDEDNLEQNNNDNNNNEPTTEIKDASNCPAGQESGLFTTTCMPIQACGNQIGVLGSAAPILSDTDNRCVNAPIVDHPSTED